MRWSGMAKLEVLWGRSHGQKLAFNNVDIKLFTHLSHLISTCTPMYIMICNQLIVARTPLFIIRRYRHGLQDWVLILTFYYMVVSTLCMLLSQADRLSARWHLGRTTIVLPGTFALAPARSPPIAFSSQCNDTIRSGCLSPPFPTLTGPLNLN